MIKTSISCSNCKSQIQLYKHNLLNFLICPECKHLLHIKFLKTETIAKVNPMDVTLFQGFSIQNKTYSLIGAIQTNNLTILLFVQFSNIVVAIRHNNELFIGKFEKTYSSLDFDKIQEKQIIEISISKFLVKQKLVEDFRSGAGQLFYNPLSDKLKILKVSDFKKDTYVIITNDDLFLLNKLNMSIEELTEIEKIFTLPKEPQQSKVAVEKTKEKENVPTPTIKEEPEEKEKTFEASTQVKTSISEESPKVIQANLASPTSENLRIICSNCGIVMEIDKNVSNNALVECPQCKNIQKLGEHKIECSRCHSLNTLTIGYEANVFACTNCNNVFKLKNSEIVEQIKLEKIQDKKTLSLINKVKEEYKIGQVLTVLGTKYKIVGSAILRMKSKDSPVHTFIMILIFLYNKDKGVAVLQMQDDDKTVRIGKKTNVKYIPKDRVIKFNKKYFLKLNIYSYELISFKGEAVFFNSEEITVYVHPLRILTIEKDKSAYYFLKTFLPHINKKPYYKKILLLTIRVIGSITIFLIGFYAIMIILIMFGNALPSNIFSLIFKVLVFILLIYAIYIPKKIDTNAGQFTKIIYSKLREYNIPDDKRLKYKWYEWV